MTAYTHTIRVSDAVFQQIEQLAKVKQQSIDALADETLRKTLPPALDNIPQRFRVDLQQLATMSDATLSRISRVDLGSEKAARYEQLLSKNSNETLEPDDRKALESLREEADLLMFRRAYALILLKQRGHTISSDTA